jgi:2-oxo-4-hydroxy-4-carboxy-5-ureidoimidazoline decarboxylase
LTIEEINALDAAGFVAAFGSLFEHSPWIVAQAEARRPFADQVAMEDAMADVAAASGRDAQLALLRAHPELAGKAAIDRTLTDASAREQASVGLDRLTEAEFAHFHALNRAYGTRFGFPFIICVRLTDKAGILAAMEARLTHDEAQEMATALAEIGKIVHLRLSDAMKVTA